MYSTEVELALYEHPDVAECAVFGVPDSRWGERVHAVVVPRTGAEIDEETLVPLHVRTLIAPYKVPRSLEIRLEPLPQSGAGKIIKRDLRDPHWAGHSARCTTGVPLQRHQGPIARTDAREELTACSKG